MKSYSEEALEFLKINGIKDSPATLVSAWESFVKACKEGYSDNMYEYTNEISCRRRLEILLQSTLLQKFDEFSSFYNVVTCIDEKFKGILHDTYVLKSHKYWWEKGVLKYAGVEFCDDIKRTYGFEIESI